MAGESIVRMGAIVLSYIILIIFLPISLLFCYFFFKVCYDYERAILIRMGIIRGKPKGPGLFFTLPCIDEFQYVDIRLMSFEVPPQEVLTKDSVTVSVDAIVFYKITDPFKSVTVIQDADGSTQLIAASTLRSVLGTRDLSQLLSDREIISHMMQSTLEEATGPWGVEVERVEIRDVRLPIQLQRAMASEVEAIRETKAKIIAAEGEVKASQALQEASSIMVDSPVTLQLRYLQTLSAISTHENSTVIFPLPLDLMKSFLK